MATLKKQRQRKTMEIKRILGLKDIALARKLAKQPYFTEIQMELDTHPELGQSTYQPGCKCCGTYYYTWPTKKGFISYENFVGFTFESNNNNS